MGDQDGPWIVIPNWSKFQHYKDRDPPWIKLYTELNSRDDWRHMPYSERGLLVTIWVEYCRSGGLLRVTDLGLRGGQRVRLRSVERLSRAGFLHFSASKPEVLARSREKSREEKNERASAQTQNGTPDGPSAHRQNAAAYQPPEHDEPDRADELPAQVADWLEQHPKPIR